MSVTDVHYRASLLIMPAIVLLAVILAGCSSTPTAPAASPGQSSQAQASVQIKDFAFSPQEIHVAKGGTVTWTNLDGTGHTVKFGDRESPLLNKGATYSRTFNETGTFDYICGIHTYMAGKVVAG